MPVGAALISLWAVISKSRCNLHQIKPLQFSRFPVLSDLKVLKPAFVFFHASPEPNRGRGELTEAGIQMRPHRGGSTTCHRRPAWTSGLRQVGVLCCSKILSGLNPVRAALLWMWRRIDRRVPKTCSAAAGSSSGGTGVVLRLAAPEHQCNNKK